MRGQVTGVGGVVGYYRLRGVMLKLPLQRQGEQGDPGEEEEDYQWECKIHCEEIRSRPQP